MKKLRDLLLGKPLNPLSINTRASILLVAFFAWIGLGSDGLSSANYGPEMAFQALGAHNHLALYIAIMMAVTVFIIALSYNQVIELFPNGGGGYKVANRLLHPYAGVVSGTALVIDYILTIAISVSAASDALFSLLPSWLQVGNLYFKLTLLVVLTWLNLRGMKESIKILTPIFIGFVLTHVVLLSYGIIAHITSASTIYSQALSQSKNIINHSGLFALFFLLFKAYSMGAGTYTGLEAVSNNVNILAEPKVRTGKYTMLYMAISLSVVAGSITLCYLLWQISPVAGKTYNALLFEKMLGHSWLGYIAWIITLLLEAGILLLGANTGFLGGPAVLSNMSVDKWVPRLFANLSSRLVRQNAVLFFGVGSILIVALLDGHVDALVVLYSTSVFLTFSITLFGLMRYWFQNRKENKTWLRKYLISLIGFAVCAFILCITVVEKLSEGSWLTLLVIVLFVYLSLGIKRYYAKIDRVLNKYAASLTKHLINKEVPMTCPASRVKTTGFSAVIILDWHRGLGIHTALHALKMFPGQLKNIIFLKVGVIDNANLNAQDSLMNLKIALEEERQFFTKWAALNHLNVEFLTKLSVNALQAYGELIDEVITAEKHYLFFGGRIVARKQDILSRLLDFSLVINLQNQLNSMGHNLIIVPMKIFA